MTVEFFSALIPLKVYKEINFAIVRAGKASNLKISQLQSSRALRHDITRLLESLACLLFPLGSNHLDNTTLSNYPIM